MAKQFGLNSTVDFAAENLMSFGKSFSRLSGQPLDKSEIWYNDLDALVAYAKTDAAFVGQKVVYIDTTANTVTHYSVELDGSLKEIGVKPLGDDASIVVDGEGTVSLKSFGVEYYRLLTSDEEGYKEGEANYVLQTVDADHPWKDGLVPRILNGALAWYEPSDITVEGLNSTVGSLQTSVGALQATVGKDAEGEDKPATGLVKAVADNAADIDSLEGRMDTAEGAIEALEDTVGDAESGLVKDVADLKTTVGDAESGLVKTVADNKAAIEGRMDDAEGAIEALEGVVGDAESGLVKTVADNKTAFDNYVADHTYTDEQIDAKVSGAFHFKGDATLETNDEGSWTGNLVKDGTVIATPAEGDVYQVGEEEYAYDGSKWVKLGFTLDLTGYATKIELNGAKTELQGNIDTKVAQTAYDTKVKALEDADAALATKDTELAAKDTELEGLIGGLRTDVDAINNAETGILKTAKDYTDDAIDGVNESIDAINDSETGILKSAKDYTDDAIDGVNESIDAINNAETGILKTAKDYTDDEIEKLNIGQYATTENLGKTNETVAGHTETLAGHTEAINAVTATANNAATKDTVNAIDERLKTAESGVSTNAANIATNTGDITNIKAEQQTQNTAIEKNKTDIAGLTETVGTNSTDIGTIKGQITSINETAGKTTSDLAALTGRVDTAEGAITAHGTSIGNNTNAIAGNTEAINAVKGRMDTAEGDIDSLEGRMDTAEGEIDALQTAVGDANSGLVKAVNDLASTKANASDVYTTEQTDTKISEAIAAADHLKREIVTELPVVESADANTIYMILDSSVAGADKYNEWMLINGSFAKVGDTTVDLTNYVQKNDSTYTGLQTDVLNLKAVGSQANVLEAVKVNGTALPITDKAVNIGVATDSVLGVVLGSSAENKVSIASDGTMTVNSVNVNKLVQTPGEVLILNGGNASN